MLRAGGAELQHILKATILGLGAGVLGTGLGAFLTAVSGIPKRRTLSMLMGIAAGVMLAIVFLDLIPEAIEIGGVAQTIGGFLLGVGATGVVDLLIPHFHFVSEDCEKNRFLRAGLLTGIGIAMHNLPEGLAIGAGYAHGESLGLSVAITIAIHNIPEGMAMAAPMCAARVEPKKSALYGALAGLPMAIGALVGAAIWSSLPLTNSFPTLRSSPRGTREPSESSWGFSWECCSFTLPEGKEEFCLCQLGQSIG